MKERIGIRISHQQITLLELLKISNGLFLIQSKNKPEYLKKITA